MKKNVVLSLMLGLLAVNSSKQANAQTTVTTPGISSLNITTAGSYTVTVVGASGGKNGTAANLGGTGSTVTGTFTLAANDVLTIIVGARGEANTTSTSGGGGGGGSAVVLNGNTLLLAAGAGGGGGRFSAGGGGLASASPTAAGGDPSSTAFVGAGGGGFGFAGGNSTNPCTNVSGGTAASLTAVSSGGIGVNQTSCTVNSSGNGFGSSGGSGFGGGGGCQVQGGGGGGGYAGGSSKGQQQGALGGDSYVNPIATNVTRTAGSEGAAPAAGSDGSATVIRNTSLPVRLLSFSVRKATSGGNDVLWVPALETEGIRFEVERSTDGNTFTLLGSESTTNKSSSTYTYHDQNPLAPVNYYRLKIMENTGEISYSNTVVIGNKAQKGGSVSIAPVPATSHITITNSDVSQHGLLASLYSMEGQLMTSFTMEAVTKINVSTWPAGIYLLYLPTGEVIRFSKQ